MGLRVGLAISRPLAGVIATRAGLNAKGCMQAPAATVQKDCRAALGLQPLRSLCKQYHRCMASNVKDRCGRAPPLSAAALPLPVPARRCLPLHSCEQTFELADTLLPSVQAQLQLAMDGQRSSGRGACGTCLSRSGIPRSRRCLHRSQAGTPAHCRVQAHICKPLRPLRRIRCE